MHKEMYMKMFDVTLLIIENIINRGIFTEY